MNTDQNLNDLLDRINYDIVLKLNDSLTVAAQSRNKILTGKGIVKLNVLGEAHRLQIYNQRTIDLAVEHIWFFRLTTSQQDQFITLANEANNINQNMAQADADT